jgi:enediyne biosynthesis protein E4
MNASNCIQLVLASVIILSLAACDQNQTGQTDASDKSQITSKSDPASSTPNAPLKPSSDSKSFPLFEPLPPATKDSKTGAGDSTTKQGPTSMAQIVAQRKQLDQTVFANEVEAQKYEQRFVALWDQLLKGDAFKVLASFPFDSLVIGKPGQQKNQSWSVSAIDITPWLVPHDQRVTLTHTEFENRLAKLEKDGWQIEQTEWHHSKFVPAKNGQLPQSVVSFEIHAQRPSASRRVIVRGKLHVQWSAKPDASGLPVPQRVDASNIIVIEQKGKPMFEPWLLVDPAKSQTQRYPRTSPLILHDLNGDGLSEIILGGCNLVYWNKGDGKFEPEDFLAHPLYPPGECGVAADFNGDGHVDYIGLAKEEGRLRLFMGTADGRFPEPSAVCFDAEFKHPHVLTAGDVDGDGDLDLFVGQWKQPYQNGSMPSPYYDANDGYPDYLLLNDGSGKFTDVTVSAGLTAKRARRTFSASLVDLDNDGDLDLMAVCDFAGLDLYRNDGKGRFTDVTNQLVDERFAFGMSHTLDDFDGDGQLDFYMIGMSSTTARRMEQLGISQPGFEKQTTKRMPMSYGNRMYLSSGKRYVAPAWQDAVARTGWAWGCTSADFDLDGDRDLYITNGHLSGKSTQDYCTQFWRHDIYAGTSKPNLALDMFFKGEMQRKLGHQVSWNGYEHNVLYLNNEGKDFLNAGYLLGVAFEFDSRGTASDDLDGDGKPDLLVVQYDAAKFQQRLHVLRNTAETKGNWIGVHLQNKNGVSPIGARVTATAGKRKWVGTVVNGDSFTSQHAHTVHFGLGVIGEIDSIEIRWQNGQSTKIDKPGINQYHIVATVE